MKRTDAQTGDWKEWRRRRAWKLYQQGWKQNAIAAALGVSKGAVSQWIKVGKTAGEEGLRGRVAKGPRPRLSEKQITQLPTLLDQGAEVHGFRGEVWSTTRVAALIKKQFGVSYHPAHMSRMLKHIHYSVQQPIKRASQRDEQAIACWKAEQWPALKKSPTRRKNHYFRR
jgi:transposase